MAHVTVTAPAQAEYTVSLSRDEALYVLGCLGAGNQTAVFKAAGVPVKFGVMETVYDLLYDALMKSGMSFEGMVTAPLFVEAGERVKKA